MGLIFSGLLFVFRGQGLIEFEILTGAVILYIGWALIHHHFDKSLTVEVIIEYILIAALILIMSEGLI